MEKHNNWVAVPGRPCWSSSCRWHSQWWGAIWQLPWSLSIQTSCCSSAPASPSFGRRPPSKSHRHDSICPFCGIPAAASARESRPRPAASPRPSRTRHRRRRTSRHTCRRGRPHSTPPKEGSWASPPSDGSWPQRRSRSPPAWGTRSVSRRWACNDRLIQQLAIEKKH